MSAGYRKAGSLAVTLVVAMLAVWWAATSDRDLGQPRAVGGTNGLSRAPAWVASRVDDVAVGPLARLEAERREADRTMWAPELRAQEHEEVFIRLWDSLRSATNAWDVLEGFGFEGIGVPETGVADPLPLDIEERSALGEERRWSSAEVRERIRAWRASGWEWVQGEFRHRRFEERLEGGARSTFFVRIHLRRAEPAERMAITAELEVIWMPRVGAEEAPRPRVLKVDDLVIRRRPETGMFVRQLSRVVTPEAGMPFIDPLLVQDLDGNGFPEVILGCRNEVYRNRGGGRFERGRLVAGWTGRTLASMVGDVTGDGWLDWVAADHEGLWVTAGARGGGWAGSPRRVWQAGERMENPMVITAGDVDGDGDLDVWLGQYKVPYVGGQMPTPYFDANDGFAGSLLVQGADGTFRDATEWAGLAGKRHRRTYSAVFSDLDGDGDVDLSLVSDFAGLDVFWNDGNGRFRERHVWAEAGLVGGDGVVMKPEVGLGVAAGGTGVASVLVGNPRGFGMAQALADLDGDGGLDLLMIGMNSFTGQRLDAMGLAGRGERASMSHGNRLYCGRPAGLVEVEVGRELAETGWSWGVGVADFDNDGHLDVHVVNGHKSRGSVRDYERQFWRHDIEVGSSEMDPTRDLYFQTVASALYGAGWSYGGFEKNRLLLGLGGGRYVEAGWLLDVGFEDDFRNLVAADLDMDGRVDLVGTTYGNWPEGRQGLHIFRNELRTGNHWIGFRLREGGRGRATIGARVTLWGGDGRVQRRWVVTGDSYRSQHPAVAHFGLGREGRVDRVEVRWPDGTLEAVEAPAVDRYHDLGGMGAVSGKSG